MCSIVKIKGFALLLLTAFILSGCEMLEQLDSLAGSLISKSKDTVETISKDLLTDVKKSAEGILESGILKGNKTLYIKGNRFTFKGDSVITYHDNGKINTAYLAKDTKAVIGQNTFVFQANRPITFYSDGSVSSGYLAIDADETIVGPYHVDFMKGTGITFHKNGGVKMGYINLLGLETKLEFNENGSFFGKIGDDIMNLIK